MELPGRGARCLEAPFDSFDEAVESSLSGIVDSLEAPYALFGHSLGALIAFDLAHKIRARRQNGPVALIVSGCSAPHVRRAPSLRSELPRAEFLAALRGLAGTPDEVIDSEELIDLLLPAMRADFRAAENYQYRACPPLDCPIYAFTGTGDSEVDQADVMEWSALTRRHFAMHTFSGGHFFLKTSQGEFLARLAATLEEVLRSRPNDFCASQDQLLRVVCASES